MVELKDKVYYVSGRVDTQTAPQLETELKEAFTEKEVELDFADLTYISSAGLRVLLKLLRAVEQLSIRNVGPGIYDILKVTDFTEIVSVEKKPVEA